YVRLGKKFISLPKGMDPLEVEMAYAKELIEEKKKADAPIYRHEDLDVQKGTGRFGPFIKWNNMFINVNKKYDFDNLSEADIIELIEAKKQKEIDKLIHNWEEEGIRLEKARWGRFNLIKGKTKIELPKTTKAEKMTLKEAQGIIEKKSPKKKPAKKKVAKSTKK
ncbi:MAG: DNA topoisomerase-1, partial [Candidatus Latescibacterota bacterium]